MPPLPYLPKSLLSETADWGFASTVQSSMGSLLSAGQDLMRPAREQVTEVVRQALPAPSPQPAPAPEMRMPEVKPFTLPSLESWGMSAPSQQTQTRPEPIDLGPKPAAAPQTAPAPAQSGSEPALSGAERSRMGGFLGAGGFSLPSLESWGIGSGARPGTPTPAPGGMGAPPTSGAAAPTARSAAPKGEVDNSSRQAFIRTAYPWALEAADGDPKLANQLVATAISENGKVGTGRSLGEMGFNVGGIQGVKGPAGSFMASDAGNMREFAAYNSLAEGFRAVRDLVSGGRYQPAAGAYRQTGDVDRYWQDVNRAGYAEDPDWHAKVGSIRRGQVEPITSAIAAQAPAATAPAATAPERSRTGQPGAAGPRFGTYTAESLTPNQFTEGQAQGLSAEEALAICGPAAAVAFARANGRNPSLREAKELAQNLGLWDVGAGMHGPASQVQLLQKMGVQARLQEGTDWTRVAQEVQAGRPVIVDTPMHYFTVTAFDPQTGEFEFGQSAGVLRKSGGKTRWRPQDLPNLGMGSPRATIFLGAGG